MMNRESFLRTMKGAPLSVLMAMFLFGPTGRKELVIRTGYGKDTVTGALELLECYELIERVNYRRWRLSGEFVQLGLFAAEESYPQVVHRDSERRKSSLSQPERRESRLSPLVVSSGSNTKIDKRIYDTCTELGIVGKKREEIARDVKVQTRGPEYIRRHVKRAKGNLGLAIFRILDGWEVEKDRRKLEEQIPERFKEYFENEERRTG